MGLTLAEQHLEHGPEQTAAEQQIHMNLLGQLLEHELLERHGKRPLNLQFRKFPMLKRLDDFDFGVQPFMDRGFFE